MPQLDQFTYFTQFFWSCLFVLILILVLVSRILIDRNYIISSKLCMHLSIPKIKLGILSLYLTTRILTPNLACCMDSSPVPSLSEISEGWIESTYGRMGDEDASSSAPQGVPQDPNGVNLPVRQAQKLDEPLAVQVVNPLIPVLEPPLIEDETRKWELLLDKLRPDVDVSMEYWPAGILDDFVSQQAEVEKRIEDALVEDGIDRQRIHRELDRLRDVLFYQKGKPILIESITRYLKQIAKGGIRESAPYRRVCRAIKNGDLFID